MMNSKTSCEMDIGTCIKQSTKHREKSCDMSPYWMMLKLIYPTYFLDAPLGDPDITDSLSFMFNPNINYDNFLNIINAYYDKLCAEKMRK